MLKYKAKRCKEFLREFGTPKRTRTVDITQTISETYGYWYDGVDFIIIRKDERGQYDPFDARYINNEEYGILVELAVMSYLK